MEGKASENQTSISSDDDIEGLKKLTDAIHANHSPVFAQLNHAGSAAKEEGDRLRGAGAQRGETSAGEHEILPQAMTTQDLEKVIADFGKAARRAKEAGF